MKNYMILGAAFGALSTAVMAQEAAQPSEVSPQIAAALVDERRPAEDRERDAGRHAAEVLALTGVGAGDRVADLVVGGGYFTRLFAAMVGPDGRVLAWQPGEFVAFQASYGEQLEAVDAAYENVDGQISRFADLDLEEGAYDLVFTAQNYHDFHLRPFPETTAGSVNGEIFRALEPCGRYFVIDHHAAAGTGFTESHTLHRADEAAVTAEVEAAGFRLIGTSDLLENGDDPMTANVFDEGIRGRTSQFVLVFQKPGEGCEVGEAG